MNSDFIFNPWWQSLGAFLFVALIIFCSYNFTRKLEDEVQDEEPKTTLEIGRYEARITRAVK